MDIPPSILGKNRSLQPHLLTRSVALQNKLQVSSGILGRNPEDVGGTTIGTGYSKQFRLDGVNCTYTSAPKKTTHC